MKSHYRVVVIGGGVVGASVLYHLAKLGWTDIALIERKELTAGSTWHAAAGFHAINADPNIAALQGYTINLYKQIEEESGQSIGLHMTGGVNMAGTPERWEWLKAAAAIFKTMGIDNARLVTPDEIKELCPICDVSGLHGGLYDADEGYLDPYGTTHAYVAAARKRGAELILRNRVLELQAAPDGSGTVVTEQGTIRAEHVVNAGGPVGQAGRADGRRRSAGHADGAPLSGHREHPGDRRHGPRDRRSPSTSRASPTCARRARACCSASTSSNPRHWQVEGAPWDYGMELIPEDIDRIAPELAKGFERFPCLNDVGIKRWVNGAFTFTPDGNPLVGPVPGLRNYWVACGVHGGLQPGRRRRPEPRPVDDRGRAGLRHLRHGRRPLRPLRLQPPLPQGHDGPVLPPPLRPHLSQRAAPRRPAACARPAPTTLMTAQGCQWGALWGLEVPLYFAPKGEPFHETPTLRRSNAFPLVGRGMPPHPRGRGPAR